MERIIVDESPELTYIQARTVERAEWPVTRWYFSHEAENRAGYSYIQANEILEQLGVLSPAARDYWLIAARAGADRWGVSVPKTGWPLT